MKAFVKVSRSLSTRGPVRLEGSPKPRADRAENEQLLSLLGASRLFIICRRRSRKTAKCIVRGSAAVAMEDVPRPLGPLYAP
ncbi:Uncharacterized protein DAT39_007385 [Clarias magur]|uniref:Uncharacterized protein n=1 Tax=Clarias magur TaxID=1594786 RepID=A0A8J4TRK7_CLAMG|nr:Uncharacterized protein DAT39_007385 [Clarias magur]